MACERTSDDDGIATAALRNQAWSAAATVCDPEVPVLTIEDLGVLRDVHVDKNGAIEVVITPTYSGCPAMDLIGLEIELAVEKAGLPRPKITRVLAPAWTTDWMSDAGKAKLKDFGIAPPKGRSGRGAFLGLGDCETIDCPRCGSQATERISEFGSTACKALWRCTACGEPFDYFKCI